MLTASQIAVAAEGINRHPHLGATARRVALELLNHADRKTGTAWPSEARMAAALGISDRSIRRAKAELAAFGLVTWIRRGTSWRGRTPVYRLAWDRLWSLAADIKAKVKAAAEVARTMIKPQIPPVKQTAEKSHRLLVDRTKLATYLSQVKIKNSSKGFWRAPGTPQGQVFTDRQLDARAQGRFYDALSRLGQSAVAQFLAHPDASQLETTAIRAERFKPDHGRSGLAVIAARLQHEVLA